MRAWQGICLSAVTLIVFCSGVQAQSITPENEYKQLIKVDQDIKPLGAHPFGENISLYDGSLSFEQTDVSLPGNGPTIQLGRSLAPEVFPGYGVSAPYPFDDWDLDIPRIETIAANPAGWQTSTAGNSTGGTNRCSNFTPPPYAPSTVGGGGGMWAPALFWYGYHLIMPGQGSQELMPRATANSLTPTMSGMNFSIVTKNNWMVSCGVTASDGGEGFLAIAPDGTRYTFAHLIYRPAATLSAPAGPIAPPPMSEGVTQNSVHPLLAGANILYRYDALMYVTQIQDRFGNTLTYNYDPTSGYLTSITASDGREVDITYVSGTPLIHSVTVKATDVTPRTWTYSYGNALTGVQLPDGSAWTFNLSTVDGAVLQVPLIQNGNAGDCATKQMPTFQASTVTGSITHPSGLTATFSMAMALHGRSYVHWECYGSANETAVFPEYYAQYSITSEVLSGAGMPTQTWQYSYSPANLSWDNDPCASGSTCPSTVYTDLLDPEGNDTRTTFSNRFDVTEGQLKQTDYYSGAAGGNLLRSDINTYADPVGGPWPTAYGTDWVYRDNQAQVTEVSPLALKQTRQDSNTYSWQAMAFDAYTQPTDVKRYSDVANQTTGIEETTSYRNDASLWVLGLPLQVTNVATGEAESSDTYSSNDTLLTRARFGQPLMSYTFNTAGQLASFTDGNSHITSLSNYKRGIPQTINYPDNTSETLSVDDLGQISGITDQLGHATSYSYDQVGRITGISYPAGDEVAWTPESFTYSFVTSAERGVAANHWKRTSALGNANTITYFDAMLRPVLSDSDIGSTVQASTMTTYDSKSQKIFSAYPSGTALTFTQTPTIAGSTTTYDALERATQVQQTSELGTLTTSTAYVTGAQQKVTDPKGNVTTSSYQVFDSPSYDAVIQVQAPTGITQTIARDIYGNPLSIQQTGLYGTENDNLTKTLTYDSYHRLCRTTEPESGSEVMSYDAANNLAWSASGLAITGTGCGQEQVVAAAQTTRTYDAMNRVKTILPPAGTQSTTYGYDPVGRMTTAVSGISSWGGTYNFRGMLTGESLQLTGQNPWAIGYAHDASGSLSLIHYPDGENVNYTPDALGRATQVGSYAGSISYFPNGQVSQFVYGNGTGYAAEQNARELLSNFSYGPGTTAQVSEDLAYDPNGNITTVTDLASGPRSKNFGYDALNRLTSANAAGLWGTQAYTYDALNNLRTLQTGSQTATYSYDATNKLSSISGALTASYTYDPRGNVATKNSMALSFDQKNQLTNIGAETFAYDAAGRRVSKVNGSTTTYYFYNQAGQLMYQVDPVALTSTNFIYLGTKMVARDVNAAPTLSSPANSATGSYVVSWTAFAGATSYNLQEQANGGSWTTIQSGSATASAITGKSNGVYGYQVQACNASTCAAWSNITSTTVLLPPAASATITVPPTSTGNVAVSWAASATATSYTLQHRLGAGGWSNAYGGAATSTSVNETATGSYTYQVQACNTGGCSAFTPSSAVAVTLPVTIAPTLTAPAISSNGSYTVSWSAVSAASTYTLQEQINGGSWTTTQNTGATSQSFSGRAAATYGYRVQGCNVDGCGPLSSVATTTVVYPPTAPSTINVPTTSTGSVAVSWSASATTTSYTLQHRLGTGGWTSAYSGASTSVGINETTTGSYTYQVQACNAGGCSTFTLSSAVAVTRPPTSAPALTVPATSYTGSYSVSWGAVTDSATYTLQEQINGGAWTTIQSTSATSDAISGKGSGSYGYRVQGCNVAGCGPLSGTGTIVVTLPPAAPPASISAPTSLTYPVGTFTVSWAAVSGATSYTLQRTFTTTNVVVSIYTGPAVSATDGNSPALINGTYVYGVKACNVAGCTGWKNSATMTIHCPGSPAVEPKLGVKPNGIKC